MPSAWVLGALRSQFRKIAFVGRTRLCGFLFKNDILLNLCALPLMLGAHYPLGWRTREDAPTLHETVRHLLVGSILDKGLGPVWFPNPVRDLWDICGLLRRGDGGFPLVGSSVLPAVF